MSPRFSLDGVDIVKTLTHLGIYLLGGVITYIAPLVTNIHLYVGKQDFSPLVAIMLGYLLDMGRKFVSDNTPAVSPTVQQ